MKVDRQKWLAERRKGIGSSEIAMVLGISPYGDQVKLYGQKVGLLEDDYEATPEMEIGLEMEDFIAGKFAKRHPEFKVVEAPFIRSQIHPWIQASPDRFLLDPKTGKLVGVVELKNVNSRHAAYWGEEHTDFAPPAFVAQVAWQAIALKMNPVRVFEDDHELPPINGAKLLRYIVPLIGGSDFREYVIPADDELDGIFVEHGQRFMSEHVIPQIPPRIDGSPSSADLLKALYPVDSDPVRVATVKETELLGLLRPRLEAYGKLEKEIDELKNRIRESIGTASGIVAPGIGTVTNKKSKDSLKYDYKAIVEILRKQVPQEMYDEIMKQHSKVTIGPRKFLPKWEGESE